MNNSKYSTKKLKMLLLIKIKIKKIDKKFKKLLLKKEKKFFSFLLKFKNKLKIIFNKINL